MALNTINITRSQDLNTSDISLQQEYIQDWNNSQYSSAFSIISSNQQLQSKVINNAFIGMLVNGILTLENYYGDNVTNYLSNLLVQFQNNINAIGYVGNYSSGALYNVGNFVTYNSQIYLCIKSGTNPITDSTSWTLIGLQGKQGAVGTGLTYVGTWSSSVQYQQYQIVSYNTGLYVSIIANSGAIPSSSPNVWLLGVDATPRGILTGTDEPASIGTGDIWWEYL